MKIKLKLVGVALAFSFGSANAGLIQVGGTAAGADGKVSNKSGVCTVNFNAGSAANTCGAVYTQSGGAAAASHFRSGSSSTAAAPNGDTTTYFTVGPTDGTPVTISLAAAANYFGFYAGSLDSYNLVQFFMNGVMVDSFTGTDINAVAFPGTSATGTNAAYIDYFPSALYNSIIYSSSANAFETDNHAFGLATPAGVPEPTSVSLLGLGALALVARQRRRSRKA